MLPCVGISVSVSWGGMTVEKTSSINPTRAVVSTKPSRDAQGSERLLTAIKDQDLERMNESHACDDV